MVPDQQEWLSQALGSTKCGIVAEVSQTTLFPPKSVAADLFPEGLSVYVRELNGWASDQSIFSGGGTLILRRPALLPRRARHWKRDRPGGDLLSLHHPSVFRRHMD